VKTVTVTWMDGKQETYTADSTGVEDGRLKIYQARGSDEPFRAIPLCNVREYTITAG
jgi:hypothetical protein